MGKRVPCRLGAVVVSVMLLLAACSSASSVSVAQETENRLGYADALIVQCALSRGTMSPPAADIELGNPPWLQGTKLVITNSNEPDFNNWFTNENGTVVAGKEIGEWAQMTASSGKLPTAVCGKSVTAPQLYRQLFAKDRATNSDPFS